MGTVKDLYEHYYKALGNEYTSNDIARAFDLTFHQSMVLASFVGFDDMDDRRQAVIVRQAIEYLSVDSWRGEYPLCSCLIKSPVEYQDVYRILLDMHAGSNPVISHAIKKLLRSGASHKTEKQDRQEVVHSLWRWQQMRVEEAL